MSDGHEVIIAPMDRPRVGRGFMFAPMLVACPSFRPAWREFVAAGWADPGHELPHYLALADLVRHLSAKLEAGETEEFDAVFDVLERWLVDGDPYVREAAVVGLIEDLQNSNLHAGTTPEQFMLWLRPQSLRWWGKVERFWEKGELLIDD